MALKMQIGLVLLGLLAVVGVGCRVAEKTAQLPVGLISGVVPGSKVEKLGPAVFQAQVQRFCDDFAGRTAAAMDEYARRRGTAEARSEVLRWKAVMGSSIVSIASGPHPVANLLDSLALTSLMRAVLEDLAPSAPNDAFGLWLETSRRLETNAWELAGVVLTEAQQAELREAIARVRVEKQSEGGPLFFERPQEIAALIREKSGDRSAPGGLFQLVGLDPTAGLDPAIREVTRSRLLAERALYVAQRMPMVARWHLDALSESYLTRMEVTNTLAAVDRLSRAAETASRTASELPDRVSAERQAVLEAVEAQEGRLRELAAEVGRTLDSGERMSTSLRTTLQTFDALMKRFGVGEAPAAPLDTNQPPFQILDYARTAEEIAGMARELDLLIRDTAGTLDAPGWEDRLRDLKALSTQARADTEAVLNRAFLLVAGLMVLAFTGSLVHRRLSKGASVGRIP